MSHAGRFTTGAVITITALLTLTGATTAAATTPHTGPNGTLTLLPNPQPPGPATTPQPPAPNQHTNQHVTEPPTAAPPLPTNATLTETLTYLTTTTNHLHQLTTQLTDTRTAHHATQQALTTATTHATTAETDLSTWARTTYINGAAPTTNQLLLQAITTNQPINDALHTLPTITHISTEHATTLTTALTTQATLTHHATTTHNHYQATLTAHQQTTTHLNNATTHLHTITTHDTTALTTALTTPGGCPTHTDPTTTPPGIDIHTTCTHLQNNAPNPHTAAAITWAFTRLGSPYACDGNGRENPLTYDCSSYTTRAYQAADIDLRTNNTSPSTHHYLTATDPRITRPTDLQPGDLVFYNTCPPGDTCDYNHVVLYAGTTPDGQHWMLHTNTCNTGAKLEPFWGTTTDPRYITTLRITP